MGDSTLLFFGSLSSDGRGEKSNFTLRVLRTTASRADKLNPSKCLANKVADISGSESYSGNHSENHRTQDMGLSPVPLE